MTKRIIIAFIIIFSGLTISFGQDQTFGDDAQAQSFPQRGDKSDVMLYPNPATDFFVIKNDKNVASVVIYNIIGKAIKTNQHNKGNVYSVEDLQKGFYIVRLFDHKNQVLKVLRLNRNYGA